jgi:hypothetical protein
MEWNRIRENFLYDLKRRPAGGRKRPSSAAETRRREAAFTRPWPASASRYARRALETCTKTRTGRFRWRAGKYQALNRMCQ